MLSLHTPQDFWRRNAPWPPLLSLPAELLELVVLHFATRLPTQPSANTTLGIESHAQSSFPSAALVVLRRHIPTPRRDHPETCLHALAERACRRTLDQGLAIATLSGGFSYLQVQADDKLSLPRGRIPRPFSVDICCLVVALVFIQRPDAIAQIQDVHTADADRMHTDRDLRPLLVEPPRSSSLTPPKTSREELQTTSCTPLRLMIVLGGYDGRDLSRDTGRLNIHNATLRRTKQFIVWEPRVKRRNADTLLRKIAILVDPPHPTIVPRHLTLSLAASLYCGGSVLLFPILTTATEPRDSGRAVCQQEEGGELPPVYHDTRLLHADVGVWDSSPFSRGATSMGSQREDQRFGGVRASWRRRRACMLSWWKVLGDIRGTGSLADHLLSEHTPFTSWCCPASFTPRGPCDSSALPVTSFFYIFSSSTTSASSTPRGPCNFLAPPVKSFVRVVLPGSIPLINDDRRFSQDGICCTIGGGEDRTPGYHPS
ncbi:hypothetical protein B0H19DRAFT_1264508 [Mycena capillaripes]|nr:hypothetical protein B0H19DRAFT_1264508 [Mycena capillaripes]